jgi:hypothetical protein
MLITPRYKAALRHLKANGYERVASWVGQYRATTYVNAWPIDELLAMEDGESFMALPPSVRKGMWRGHLNTRDLRRGKDIRANDVIRAAEKLTGGKL